MVHPLTPFAVRGMLWYQGEDNHQDGPAYAEKLKALIHCWRKYFECPNLPIYIVQLPPWHYGKESPTFIPRFRAAQQKFAETDPHAGYIVTTDCGDPKDIHPKNKLPLGLRLANLVLYKEYKTGDDSALSPTFAGFTLKGDTVVVKFNHPNGLKTSDGKDVSSLELAGKDGIFYPATGRIENDTLIVSSEKVKAPEQLQFGWHKLAIPNFFNRKGIPVTTFSVKLK
jgi:sialate O-acetylesterase